MHKDFPISKDIILYLQVFAERSNKYDSHPSLVVINSLTLEPLKNGCTRQVLLWFPAKKISR